MWNIFPPDFFGLFNSCILQFGKINHYVPKSNAEHHSGMNWKASKKFGFGKIFLLFLSLKFLMLNKAAFIYLIWFSFYWFILFYMYLFIIL